MPLVFFSRANAFSRSVHCGLF